MAPSIDFQSEDGFITTAKKGKKNAKAPAKAKWADDEDEDGSKKADEEGSNGGDKGNDTGAGGEGGDKKDEGGDDGSKETKPEDDWDSFLPAKGKKKGKKGKAEEAAVDSSATDKFDAFQEIKLDDTGPMLDLSFDTGTTSASKSFGDWGTSWKTGTTRFVQ
jgi:hypothetical protein